jgi:hypothetical protein
MTCFKCHEKMKGYIACSLNSTEMIECIKCKSEW